MFELTRTDAHHMILRKSPTIPAVVSGDVDSLDDESMTANRGESKLCGCRRAISTSDNGYVPTQNGNCPHSDEARATGSTAGGECRGVEVYKEGGCGCVFSLCPPSRPQGVLSFPPTQPTPLLILLPSHLPPCSASSPSPSSPRSARLPRSLLLNSYSVTME